MPLMTVDTIDRQSDTTFIVIGIRGKDNMVFSGTEDFATRCLGAGATMVPSIAHDEAQADGIQYTAANDFLATIMTALIINRTDKIDHARREKKIPVAQDALSPRATAIKEIATELGFLPDKKANQIVGIYEPELRAKLRQKIDAVFSQWATYDALSSQPGSRPYLEALYETVGRSDSALPQTRKMLAARGLLPEGHKTDDQKSASQPTETPNVLHTQLQAASAISYQQVKLPDSSSGDSTEMKKLATALKIGVAGLVVACLGCLGSVFLASNTNNNQKEFAPTETPVVTAISEDAGMSPVLPKITLEDDSLPTPAAASAVLPTPIPDKIPDKINPAASSCQQAFPNCKFKKGDETLFQFGRNVQAKAATGKCKLADGLDSSSNLATLVNRLVSTNKIANRNNVPPGDLIVPGCQ